MTPSLFAAKAAAADRQAAADLCARHPGRHNGEMPAPAAPTNVADRLTAAAAAQPDAVAVVDLRSSRHATCTFRELDADAAALARGLLDWGVNPGDRLVLLVKPGIAFVKLVFALLRAGVVTVLIDPGMGGSHLLNCIAAADPHGFVATSAAQAVRTLMRRRFPKARRNVTVGRRWFWRGPSYEKLLARGRKSGAALPATGRDDPAAIIFTSGSTGPPKGVLYTHQMFDAQAGEIQRTYNLRPGGVDLACFALFGLFNSAMGVTTVFPDMDFSRPASADARKLLAAANAWQVTQAFASPAVWDKLSRHCEQSGDRIPTLRKVFSCGAPVPAAVLRRTLAMVHPGAEMHTPYGATEALPVATIDAREVLRDTAAKTDEGAGVCIGRKFDSIEWRVIRLSDGPIESIEEVEELGVGEIGELVVRGAQVSPAYVVGNDEIRMTNDELRDYASFAIQDSPLRANILSKIPDEGAVWHRMGDAGYVDRVGRFWYCGRKSHRVETDSGTLFTECCEAIFNNVFRRPRCALVGVVPAGRQVAVLVVSTLGLDQELLPSGLRPSWEAISQRLGALAGEHSATRLVGHFLPYNRRLPVDVRHNAKINREQLAAWAEQQLPLGPIMPIAGERDRS